MIPRHLLGDKYFAEEFARQTEGGKARMAFEFKAGLRDKKTGEVKKAYKDQVREAFEAEQAEMKSGNSKPVNRPVNNAKRAMKNKEVKL